MFNYSFCETPPVLLFIHKNIYLYINMFEKGVYCISNEMLIFWSRNTLIDEAFKTNRLFSVRINLIIYIILKGEISLNSWVFPSFLWEDDIINVFLCKSSYFLQNFCSSNEFHLPLYPQFFGLEPGQCSYCWNAINKWTSINRFWRSNYLFNRVWSLNFIKEFILL